MNDHFSSSSFTSCSHSYSLHLYSTFFLPILFKHSLHCIFLLYLFLAIFFTFQFSSFFFSLFYFFLHIPLDFFFFFSLHLLTPTPSSLLSLSFFLAYKWDDFLTISLIISEIKNQDVFRCFIWAERGTKKMTNIRIICTSRKKKTVIFHLF